MCSGEDKAGKTETGKKVEEENANKAEKPEGWEGRRLGAQVAEETGLEKGEKKAK